MFGISFFELIVFLIIALLFVKPQDLPEIVRFCGRMIYRGKKMLRSFKDSLAEISDDLGVEDLKQEFHEGIALEKSKLEDDFTVIVDMEGNEHKVPNIKDIRPDLSEEEIDKEVQKVNKANSQK